MKKYFGLLLSIFVVFTFVGCDFPSERTANYLEIYGDFLNYSLGDYTVISEDTEQFYPVMSDKPVTYTAWTLEYTRYDGEVRNISFNNLNIKNDIGNDVIWAAGSIWLEQIKQDVISRYFGLETMDPFVYFAREWDDSPTTLTRLEIIPQFQRDSGSINFDDMLNPHTGLQLYSITLPELLTKWDIAYQINLSTIDDENYLDILERFKAMIRKLSEYTEHERVLVDFRASNEKGIIDGMSFLGYYDKQADTFNLTYR